ncbi:MAG TPA: hypothetical protein VI278_05410 [Nitrososphaeraceae archaeon]
MVTLISKDLAKIGFMSTGAKFSISKTPAVESRYGPRVALVHATSLA